MSRREYAINMVVNGIWIRRVVIDPHYEAKHSGSVTDGLVIELVKALHGERVGADCRCPPFTYFRSEKIRLDGKLYRLIWLLEDDRDYIGVLNAFRR